MQKVTDVTSTCTDLPAFNETLLKDLYRQMVFVRAVEETLLALFSEGLLRGTIHTCLGQEGTAVGVVAALDRGRDLICSNHRGHGHYLAYCGDATGLIAEIMGRADGICGGLGGSQHLHRDNFYANGILGGMAPVAVGMALAEKWRDSGAVATVFLGDGAMAEGVVGEAMNLAALWQVPILFAVEHNGIAQSTPSHLTQAGDLARRGDAFGIPTRTVDGNDVLAVHAAASHLVTSIRGGSGPQILLMHTYRLGPHSKGDDLRSRAEIAAHEQTQPITRARQMLPVDWCETTEATVAAEVSAIAATLRQPVAGAVS